MALTEISIRGAREHNLKGIDLDIPRDQLVVITGLSGSGKSTLAFDTIYAEGQRKYMESMSAYARQFLDQLQKPDVESVEGLPPTIAIEQRGSSHNPRSTVATTTEIYDYLRLLFARVGQPRCWHVDEKGKECGTPIESQSATQIVDHVMGLPEGSKLMVLSPVIRGKKGHHKEVFEGMVRQGFVRARVNGEVMDLREIAKTKAGTPFTTKTQRYQKHTVEAVVDRIVVQHGETDEDGNNPVRTRVADSIELSLKLAEGLAVVTVANEEGGWDDTLFSEKYACPIHPECSLEDLEPRLFSFNSPYGACPSCSGLGTVFEFDAELVVADPELSLSEGAIEPWRKNGKRMNIFYNRIIRKFCKEFEVSPQTPWKKLPKPIRRIMMEGTTTRDETKYGSHFEGVLPNLQRRFETTDSEFVKQRLSSYLSESACETCGGARLRTEALHVFIASGKKEYNINDVVNMTIEEASDFFGRLRLSAEGEQIAEPIVKEIRARLGFMLSVGLGYLNLSRNTGTLSGGESQRIRLATQVGSGLVGCCYVLDEPTIGLHQRDNDRLIKTLRHLTDIGNTVLVVEHDEDTIRAADYLIDVGPGPGRHGGTITAHGPRKKFLRDKKSLTAKYLRGDEEIPTPTERRSLDHKQCLTVKGARQNNLQDVTAAFPLGGIVTVTGVSGSGKSTLVNQILLKAAKRSLLGSRVKPGDHDKLTGVTNIDRTIEVDQSPIGRTPRSNPATYTGVFDMIRDLFTKTKEAKIRGYKPGRFSFNVKGGRCEACQGQGTKKIEMHFLPDVFVQCDVCKGKRYNRETLEITYRGKNISDVLNMTVEEALEFFDSFSDVKRLLTALNDVGLSYVQLGQASTTLSGGEAQRVKLATELGKRSTGHTLYVLDEPTTGLHFADVKKLISVLDRLADGGNTVILIEHNLDVIKCSDWLIDLGPEGGDRGGTIVVTGTPEDVAEHEASYTGRFLKTHLPEPITA
ncbi:excinuclease ABC subunit UvrA [Algisphaera agarilytica]|uniref:UvrABC system protein A n=1 Tax=Algisphaera agarilytica TaxID=1385975 RepID=A0A7X0H8V2_9BACT|nr:excinuclease ABC subunit UvrA [Algisphaera agarilytica]MBB6431434.1 excinuclease ABC subunit A [Algisphaera agarilytica]